MCTKQTTRRMGPGRLQWVQTRLATPEGLVFIPPLIGGGPAQQLGTFRWLLKSKLDLFSYNYTGHGGSAGRFSLTATIRDTRLMMALAARRAENTGVPLYGIAACYATVPMLYGTRTTGEPFRKVILINPLTAFYQGTILHAVYRSCRTGFDLKRPFRSLGKAIDGHLESLFPNISRSTAGFGSLSRKRTRVLTVLIEWLAFNKRLDFSLPHTPALCVYSRQDPIMNLGGGALGKANLDCIGKVCSPVTFHAINSDHFLSDPQSRAVTRQAIRSFLLTG